MMLRHFSKRIIVSSHHHFYQQQHNHRFLSRALQSSFGRNFEHQQRVVSSSFIIRFSSSSSSIPEEESYANTTPTTTTTTTIPNDDAVNAVVVIPSKQNTATSPQQQQKRNSPPITKTNIENKNNNTNVPTNKRTTRTTPPNRPQTENSPPPLSTSPSPRHIRSFYGQIDRSLRSQNLPLSLKQFRKSVTQTIPLLPSHHASLLALISVYQYTNLFDVFHRAISLKQTLPIESYRKLCICVRFFHGDYSTPKFLYMVDVLMQNIPEGYQSECLPELLISLVMTRKESGIAARRVWEFLKRKKTNWKDVDDGALYCEVLAYSYRTSRGVDFSEVLKLLVDRNYHPKAWLAISALESIHPFTNTTATLSFLHSISRLSSSSSSQKPKIDLGLLETISYQATPDIIRCLWDCCETYGYAPTEPMYENAVYAFIRNGYEDHLALSILKEMEEKGFEVKTELVRSVGRSIRTSIGRIDNAYYIITNKHNPNSSLTTTSLNIVLSACAELSQVDRAFATFSDFERFRRFMQPNDDSYEFVLQSLVHRNDTTLDVKERFQAAYEVWNMMESKQRRRYGLHYYVIVCCLCGNADLAWEVLEQCMELRNEIFCRTFELVVLEYAKRGDIAMARKVMDVGSVESERSVAEYVRKRVDWLEEESLRKKKKDEILEEEEEEERKDRDESLENDE